MSRMACPDLSSPAPAAPGSPTAGEAAGVDAASGESEGLANIARQSTEKGCRVARGREPAPPGRLRLPGVLLLVILVTSALTMQGPPPIIRGPLRRRGG